MTVLTVDFEMTFWRARSGQNKTILLLFSFFLIFNAIMRFMKIHYLTREFHLHLKTDIARSEAMHTPLHDLSGQTKNNNNTFI